MICVIHAHPYPSHSRATNALLAAVRTLPDTTVRSLYDLYPDFDIDVEAEQDALMRASLVVWLHPLYWYSVPGLQKHWFNKVLANGWAYGEAHALSGKRCLWACTTGGEAGAYAAAGVHGQGFADFVAPIERTARFCRMQWLAPFIVHAAEALPQPRLAEQGQRLRELIAQYASVEVAA